jgi:hypothetical protein
MLEDEVGMQFLEMAAQPWGGCVVVHEMRRSPGGWFSVPVQIDLRRRDTSSDQERETLWCWRGGDPILEVEAAGFTSDGGGELESRRRSCGGAGRTRSDEEG